MMIDLMVGFQGLRKVANWCIDRVAQHQVLHFNHSSEVFAVWKDAGFWLETSSLIA
jgi:hypothetical protein